MAKKIKGFFSSKIIIAALVIVIGGGIWFLIVRSHKTTYQFVTVKSGTITEVVSVTGNVTSTRSVDLAFENGGTIAAVYDNEGDYVNAGDVIAKLDTQDLQAQLAQAQANVDAETATLANLQAGSTPQSIAVSQTALTAAEQTLTNSYASVPTIIASAYASANDAVRNQLSTFFTDAETNNPQFTLSVNNSQLVNDVIFERMQASTELNTWQAEMDATTAATPSSTLDTILKNAVTHLMVAKTLLTTTLNAIVDSTNISSEAATSYRNDVTNGLNEVNTSMSNINAAMQSIASEKVSVLQAEAQLNLTLAGPTEDAIQAQTAQVEQAKASMQSIQVKIDKASLIAPMSGIVTTQNAKPGEIASPGVPVVSLMTDNSLEVDADVPEIDIGKLSLGDPVSMTIDAFPNETFSGKVFYIDPAQTIISGVVDYEIKVAFAKNDPRMKSGLTVNLDITTQTKNDVLILPQYAVLQNDSGSFVETLAGNVAVQQPVTLGISDQNGNVEIASGVTEGERVVNIGLK